MTFNEILVDLQNGKKFRRHRWDIVDYYRIVNDGDHYCFLTQDYGEEYNSYETMLDAEDIMADDWEEVK